MTSFDFNEMREATLRGIEVGIIIGEFSTMTGGRLRLGVG